MKKSIWFVINPISGVRRKDDLPELIHEHIDHTQFDYKIKSSSYKGQAIEIA
ncbi:MAG: diacylglycerol kinase family lipid kinase, partial [Crocinitomicaceae bacterium]|nr:diacylglycerol kinase family lipid kinase [Crocinitomicaceae bacterium]NDC92713.1 diacylglycerol kinase family lipid kinase [Flavobacteriales bacterium]